MSGSSGLMRQESSRSAHGHRSDTHERTVSQTQNSQKEAHLVIHQQSHQGLPTSSSYTIPALHTAQTHGSSLPQISPKDSPISKAPQSSPKPSSQAGQSGQRALSSSSHNQAQVVQHQALSSAQAIQAVQHQHHHTTHYTNNPTTTPATTHSPIKTPAPITATANQQPPLLPPDSPFSKPPPNTLAHPSEAPSRASLPGVQTNTNDLPSSELPFEVTAELNQLRAENSQLRALVGQLQEDNAYVLQLNDYLLQKVQIVKGWEREGGLGDSMV